MPTKPLIPRCYYLLDDLSTLHTFILIIIQPKVASSMILFNFKTENPFVASDHTNVPRDTTK